MKHAAKILAVGTAMAATLVASAGAADLAEPIVYEAPVYEAPEALPKAAGGWYLRGDIGYRLNTFHGADYMTATGFDGYLDGSLSNSYSIGGGVGYHVNHYLRADLTLDYDFKTDFEGSTTGTCTFTDPGPDGVLGTVDDIPGATRDCTSSDISGYKAWTLLSNAYVDLGTYSGFTPYVGAGIGGAYVQWHELTNTISGGNDQDGTYVHEGSSDWRFAYALMAGVSYAVNHNVSVDLGYRYKKIAGSHMFGYEAVSGTGIGVDRGISSHEFRAGLRYKFGGGEQAVYHPVPTPIYK